MHYAEKFTVLVPVYCQSYVSYVKFRTFVLRMRLSSESTPVANTQWCAFQSGLLALALFHAALRAFARDELPADLGCFG